MPNHTLVLLDTEGLGDLAKVRHRVTDKSYLFWIFYLSILDILKVNYCDLFGKSRNSTIANDANWFV